MNCNVLIEEQCTSSKGMSNHVGEVEEIFHPVVCDICTTEVAMRDEDEIYHFFNVIPGNG